MFHEADPPNPVSRQARLVLPILPVERIYAHLTRSASFDDSFLSGSSVSQYHRWRPYYFTNSGFLPCRSPARRSYKIYSCNITLSEYFVTLPISRWYWCNVIYRVTTPEMDRVYRKLGTKVRVIIQIRCQWDLNPRPLAWRSSNLTTTLRSPDLLTN